MRPMARLYAKKAASRSAAVKMTQGGLYFLAESANLLLQKREEGLKIDSESERLKTCGGGLRSPSYRAMENHIQRKGMNKMNQTQTRSPRKRLLSLILAVILMIGLLPISAFATSASAQAGEDKAATQDSEFLRIFHLDCGRKYFTVSEIEGIIDQLAENHYTHIQLAFGNNGFRFLLNDMSVKANNKTYSSDDVKNAVTNGNTTYSNGKNTASTMLSETDMDTIIAYAKGKDISIIPMLNTPGHMDALVSAMMELNVGTQRSDSEMSLTSDAQVEFIKALQQKYITYFASKGSKYYNLAADEYSFSGLSNTEYTVFAKYVNEVAKMVKDAKMTPLAYNDGFLYSGKATSVPFDKDIVICYWAQDTNYASVTELHNAGFKILNNNDAWYYVLGDYLYDVWATGQWGYEDALKGIKSTPVTQAKNVADKEIPVVGSVLCCWCDGPSKSWAGSRDEVYDLIATMAKYNPDYFTGKVKLSASDDATGVSVAVTGAKGQKATVEVKKITSGFTFDTEAHVSYNVTPAVDGKAYTGEGTVTLPVPEGWATEDSRIQAYIIDNGAVKLISGTLSGGKYTFQVPHFSEMGLVQLAKGAGSTENVTVAVGRTSKAYDLTGDNLPGDGTYKTDDGIASYTIATSTGEMTATKATSIDSKTEYIIGNGSQYLTLSGSSITPTTNLDDATKWTISSSGTGYTIKLGSYYLSRSSSWSGYSLSASTIPATWYWNANDGFYFTSSWDTYYLTYSTYSDGWTVSRQSGARGGGQPYTVTEVPGGKTVTFKGLNPGSTSVTLGDTTYSVTVTEKQNVEIPISIIDYRADGLLFDWTYLGNSYAYGLVHVYSGNGSYSNFANVEYGQTLDGSKYGTKIPGTTLERTRTTGDVHASWNDNVRNDNSWSRAGLVQERLGANGMPVYTDDTVKYVASLLASGNYNAVSDNRNSVLQDTFLKTGASRSVLTDTAPTNFSENFKNAKTYANIKNAYDLAWYLLNTIYQADTNMTTVTGTDKKEHSVPIYGMAVDAYKSIVLTDNGTGTYSFEAGYSGNPKYVDYDRTNGTISQGTGGTATVGFYPLENLGYEQPGLLTKTSVIDGNNRNGDFTLRGESQFVYNKDSNLYFTFTGDDDVYMYINGVLALDLGGAHGRNNKTVNLNDLDPTKYGLKEGQVATFTFFYMERCSDASTFGIETNMELVQRAINVEKKAYDTSYANEYASGTAVINGTTVAYDLIVTNKSNSPMTQIKLTDTDSLHSENGSEYGKAELGYGVTTPSVTASTWIDPERRGTVALGQGNGYVLFITDSTGTEVANTRKSLSSLQALSDEIAGLTLPAGQSLHVRFLTATTAIEPSKILDYINTVEVSAKVGGQALSDTASHELYSYNANDTGRTYVVDFGLPLEIKGIFDTGAKDNIVDVSLSPNNVQKYGTVTIAPNGFDTTLTYTRTADKTINEPETITLDVVYKIGNSNIKLEKTLTIIPASNVYYEDSLASFSDGKGVAKEAKWSTVGNNDQTTTEDGGSDVYQALQQLGDKAIYGNDDAYNSSSKLSMGTAHKVTVTSEMLAKWEKDDTTSAWPTAQFTFKGTGFDIISLTDNTSGVIQVKVYKANSTDTTPVKNILVNNYYGYTRDGAGNWVVSNSEDPNALYQIPVVKVDGLDYGTYNVTIEVFYSKYFDKTTKSQYSFWLDAIRVYNPMGEGYDYTADNEGYPQYIKLHDKLADTAATSGDEQVLFIDGAEHATIAQYANYGPKNEVYLAKGQAISFKLTGNTNEIASIQIGAKAPDGQPTMTVKGNGSTTSAKNEVLSTATEMYYDITEQAKNGQLVTISNTSGSILSLTNLKITYKISGQTVTLSDLTATEQANAVAVVQALFAAPVATFSPETFQADWGRAVRAGKRATLTVKTSADVESITVDGQAITSYTTRTQRTGWGWWSPKVTYHVFTYTITAPAQTTDYAVCAVNAEGTASEAVTATLTVRPATWWNWWF